MASVSEVSSLYWAGSWCAVSHVLVDKGRHGAWAFGFDGRQDGCFFDRDVMSRIVDFIFSNSLTPKRMSVDSFYGRIRRNDREYYESTRKTPRLTATCETEVNSVNSRQH
jgi:hypothetical protein